MLSFTDTNLTSLRDLVFSGLVTVLLLSTPACRKEPPRIQISREDVERTIAAIESSVPPEDSHTFEIGIAEPSQDVEGPQAAPERGPIPVVLARPVNATDCDPAALTGLGLRLASLAQGRGCSGLLGCVRLLCQAESGFLVAIGSDPKGIAWSSGKGALPSHVLGADLKKLSPKE